MKKGIGDFGNPIGDSGNVKVDMAEVTGTIVESLDLIPNKPTATDVYVWSQGAISVTVDTE